MKKLRIMKKWRKLSLYKKSLILFTVLLVILGSIFLGYVYNSMIIYERNLVDNYITYLAMSGNLTKNIDDNLFKISPYEKSNAKIIDGIKKVLKSDELEIKKNTKLSENGIFVYDLKIDGNVFSTVSLKSVNNYKRMGILTIDEWDVTDIKTNFDNGIYYYEINIPSNYKVYINNKEVLDSDITKEGDVQGLERLTKYVEILKSKTFTINNLVYEPTIKIVDDNNKEVSYKIEDHKIVVTKEFTEVSTLEDAKKYIKDDFDILGLAEKYSLFLTDDLAHGVYGHGFSKLTPYLIKDSYMYDMAHGWAYQVDITFVSNHRLKNPTFTNEMVKNFIFYNDLAFSCEVYLEKNMVVSGKDKVDTMHDRLYFIYYNDGYKLVDMKSIKD